MYKFISSFVLILIVSTSSNYSFSQIKSPAEFLPHEYGREFTPHHLLVDYVEYVAEEADHIVLDEYGKTNESRPLIYAIITSEKNHAQLETIRKDNLRRAGLLDGETTTNIPIVWLSYNVHGNEAGGSESALTTIYELGAKVDSKVEDWLEKVVIVFDPCINPDGYSRYTSWNNQVANKILNPNPESAEHNEPWPGGRVNHYLFDLNRDWAWLSQVESKQRIKIYRDWMPQVHVDFHEMGHNSPYYFAPASKPYHDFITDWQGDFQFQIGKNHAKYFDQEGWTYFTREVFDLFYPSYGDTYPTFNGSIGMTYEQGGHGRAGQGIEMNNGDTLRLQDRIDHHHTTSMSTIEMTVLNGPALLENFSNYFEEFQKNPPGKHKSFIISQDNNRNKVERLLQLLDEHQIQYGSYSGGKASLKGFQYHSFSEGSVEAKEGDLLISAHQPKAVLTQVLFEPDPSLEDSLTYDITAWALPFAFGLKGWALENKMSPKGEFKIKESPLKDLANPYAILVPWGSTQSARLLSRVYQNNIRTRVATESFTLEGRTYPHGTLVILKADNKTMPDWHQLVSKDARDLDHEIVFATTGFSENGNDLGSSSMRILKAPSVLVFGGEGVNPNSFGQVWHWHETEMQYPLTVADQGRIGRMALDNYDVIIMPGGRYSLSENERSGLNDWVRGGGTIISMGRAVGQFADKEGSALKRKSSEEEEGPNLEEYIGQDRRYITHQMPGAIFKTKTDNTHPLAYGLTDHYATLKTSPASYQLLDNGWNVGLIEEDAPYVGFGGAKAVEASQNSLSFGIENKGRGSRVYLVDNPLFRGFWEEGELLMANAVLIVGGL
ncbi:MAG: zinc carboxypeptidase [Saprospiraceae bacterium]|nr:zinc carboxypeptidase [Saprospiraceae bacterium]